MESKNDSFNQNIFNEIIIDSVNSHELSDVSNVGLLSGGIDSAIIARLSKFQIFIQLD